MSLELIQKGVDCCRNNAYEKGIEFFNSALKEYPDHIEALYNRARAYSKVDELEKSLNDFKRLVEIQPLNPSFIGDYAVALHLNNKNDEASIQFEKALQLEPENPYRYSSRAFFKDRIGDHEGALLDYDKAIALDPEDAIAINNRGLVEEKLGYAERAKKSFEKSNDLVGYKPDVEKEIKPEPKIEPPKASATKAEVLKTLLTKDGLKDFGKFTANLFKPKK
ncbi:tetratricopeptide repeat protein [Roseivirga sp.]|uniref:tetratricopeptide repeat protein n=1 Tax=Roseivirga sp. TaxID=1964215 RepID=UPI003B8ACC47